MANKLGIFIRKNWLLVGLTLATLLVILWFGSRLVMDFIFFNDPRNVDVDLKGWMTPRFVVLTYDLPRDYVAEILELESEDRGKRLRHVADDLGLTLEELTQKVRDAAETYRASQSD